MVRISFNKGWQYRQASSWWSPTGRINVDLPHDYSMELPRTETAVCDNSGGYFQGGIIMYSKEFFVPDDWKNKYVCVEFEGVYMNALVKINGNIIKKQPYGYSSFHCELNEKLKYGENNTIEVKVTNDTKNSRWYSGTGIYRPVYLYVSEKTHIKPWGTYIITDEVTPDLAWVKIFTDVVINCEQPLNLSYTIKDAMGKDVMSWLEPLNSSENYAQMKIFGPNLWTDSTPYLYTLTTKIITKHTFKVLDEKTDTFGIREISWSRDGLKINGNVIKLKGGCVHHDNGIIGAASYKASEQRKVQLLKNAGYNAVRCSHNPPSVFFLDACDKIGLYVIDEIFDGWVENKTPYDYGMHFEDWWERDFESMLLRDRNHPSVIAWSTGNEVSERGGKSDGYIWAKRLSDFAKKYDPTRFTTNAANDIAGDLEGLAANVANPDGKGKFGALTEHFFAPLDVAGYNYLNNRYEDDSKLFPDRIICGLESFPLAVFENWEEVNKLPNVIGDFVWTAIDYFGEAGLGHVWYNGETSFLGSFPWHFANCGDFDVCYHKRPQSFYRDAMWGVTKTPYIAVYDPNLTQDTANVSKWGWPDVVSAWDFTGHEDKLLDVEIYCSCDEVELFLNSESLGKKTCGHENKYKAMYKVPFKAGEIKAVSYNGGEVMEEYLLKTPACAAKIKLTADKIIHEYNESLNDLCYIDIEINDKDGNLVRCTNEVTVSIENGELLALGSADPLSTEMYNQNKRHLYEGVGLLVVKALNKGEVKVIVSSENISDESLSFHVV